MVPALKFLNRYVNNWNAYALQQPDGQYFTKYEPVTPELLMKHLIGEHTLGVYAVDPKTQTSKWGCWDIDDDQEDNVSRLLAWLAGLNITCVRESVRPGRSGHIWMHFVEPISSPDVFQILKIGQIQFGLKGEIYPHGPNEVTNVGKLVRLPLGRHRKFSDLWGLYKDCAERRPIEDQIYWFNQQPLNCHDNVRTLLGLLPPVEKPKRSVPQVNKQSLMAEFPEDYEFKQMPSGEYIAGCPNCIAYGFDETHNNLAVNAEGTLLYCHGGCSFIEIMQAVRLLKSQYIIA